MRYIGDVHGKFARYKTIIRDCEESIQVGDMGVGFRHLDGTPMENPPHSAMIQGNHRFIRGNHDNPAVCKAHSQYIPDGTFDPKTGIMFIGGALSIDKEYRREGYDWWPDEELSYPDFEILVEEYVQNKPEVMITHECPESIAHELFNVSTKSSFYSITRRAFDTMIRFHKPKLHIFGHWHQSRDRVIDGTRYICLAELEYIDL